MENYAIKIQGVKKQYRLGQIGGGTLTADLQSWWARVRGKEDPNLKLDQDQRLIGKSFMALNGIDLTIDQGEAVGIIGHNGAGKSTLLKLLSRVTAPTAGTIDINGRIASMLEVGTGFSPEMTGRENVYLNGTILGMTKAEVDAKMDKIIEFSEIGDFIDTPVKRYSSGMYVKLAFSVAAHLDSEIMIMDEVLAVGDMAFQKKCLGKMREAAKTDGRTVLYVSHNMTTIRQLCDRCIVLDQGKVIFDGDTETAIGIYTGNTGDRKHACLTELDDADRPSKQHGSRVRLQYFKFLDKEMSVFERTEPCEFEIGVKALDKLDGLMLYFIIKTTSGQKVGMMQSPSAFADMLDGDEKAYRFSLDISNLAPGEYEFIPDVFISDDNGNHLSLDHPMRPIRFEICDTNSKGLNWNTNYYGNVRLNPITFKKEIAV